MQENPREFHAVADLFPPLRGAALEELVADIKQNGLLEPILVDAEGRILDGRNRYRACLAAGVEPRFVRWEGEGSLPELALSRNLRRRHLGDAAGAGGGATGEAIRKGGLAKTGPTYGKARDKAGALVNVSPRLIPSALKVLRHGSDELGAAV